MPLCRCPLKRASASTAASCCASSRRRARHRGLGREAARQLDVDAVVARLRRRAAACRSPPARGRRQASASSPKRSQLRASISAQHKNVSSSRSGSRVRSRSRSLPAYGLGAVTAEGEAALGEQREHLLEVHQLLAREPRERREQGGVLRIAEEQLHRGAGGLLLAVRVVDQQLVAGGASARGAQAGSVAAASASIGAQGNRRSPAG